MSLVPIHCDQNTCPPHRLGLGRATTTGLHRWLWPSVVCVVLLALGGRVGAESARTAQLVRLLHDRDFRVRTQAAFSLGRVDDPAAVSALIEVLNDDHPAVRAAAAVALGRLGAPAALEPLRRHHDSSSAVADQVRRAIARIESRQGPDTAIDWARARYYVELATVTNVSKTRRPGLEKLIRTLAMRELRRLPGVAAADSERRPPDVNKQLAKRRLPGYSVTVSLGRLVRYMGPQKVRVRAEVMLAVMSYPENNYRMTANGAAAVTVPRRSFRKSQVPALQEDALAGALQEAFRTLGATLAKQHPPRRRSHHRRRRR